MLGCVISMWLTNLHLQYRDQVVKNSLSSSGWAGLLLLWTEKCSQDHTEHTEPMQHAEKDKHQVLKCPQLLLDASTGICGGEQQSGCRSAPVPEHHTEWCRLFISRAGIWSLSHTHVLSRPVVLPPLFQSLSNSVCLSFSVCLCSATHASQCDVLEASRQ